jgi:lipoyl(octanoyl) transferase
LTGEERRRAGSVQVSAEARALEQALPPRDAARTESEGRRLEVRRLGRIGYAEALEIQAGLVAERQAGRIPDTLLLLEHEPVFTLGRNARRANVLLPEEDLRARGFEVFETGRGGDVTYHGPGQLVGYPILHLSPERRDVHRYVRDLEEVMIRVCADYGVIARRIPGLTGTWVGEEKIGAIGVRIARWVTSHGFALNVTNDLSPFGLIVPCGIRERGVTSLERQVGQAVSTLEVADRVTQRFAEVFEARVTRTPS